MQRGRGAHRWPGFGLASAAAFIAAACGGQSHDGVPDASLATGAAPASGGAGAGGTSAGAGGTTTGVTTIPGTAGTLAASGGATIASGGAAQASGGSAGATSCDPSTCTPIPCPHGQVAAVLAGGCCRQICVSPGALSDAGTAGHGPPAMSIDAGTCMRRDPPACQSNNWPYCAPDWSTAMSWYMTCPNPFSDAYLGTCSGMNAVVVSGPYRTQAYLYDHFGRLSGFMSAGEGEARCEAYLPGFTPPTESCIPSGAPCYDAGAPHLPDLSGLDAGAIATWGDTPPDCKTGQAAYNAYLASQLARYNTCSSDQFCLNSGPPGLEGPMNRCAQPCDLFFTIPAINSQILSRLDRFGDVACARCDVGPPPACPLQPFVQGKCVNGSCVFPQN